MDGRKKQHEDKTIICKLLSDYESMIRLIIENKICSAVNVFILSSELKDENRRTRILNLIDKRYEKEILAGKTK